MATLRSNQFFFDATQRLAVSLACLQPTPLSQLEHLLSLCPQEISEVFHLSYRGQDALMALGVYLLRSELQHKDLLLPYLLRLLQGLSKAVWPTASRYIKPVSNPNCERFAFLLNTLLSDVACLDKTDRHRIVATQVDCLMALANLCFSPQPSEERLHKSTLVKVYLPLFIGSANALGRGNTSEPLFLQMFAQPSKTSVQPSQNLFEGQANEDCPFQVYSAQSLGPSFGIDLKQDNNPLTFCLAHFQTLLSFTDKLLNKANLDFLDALASKVFADDSSNLFPYRTFSDVLKLVLVNLLWKLVEHHRDIPTKMTNSISSFALGLFDADPCQSCLKEFDSNQSDANLAALERLKINPHIHAICIDLLVWSVADETNGDKLLSQLTERINLEQGQRLIVSHLVLLMACLRGIGELARRFPSLALTCITALQQFTLMLSSQAFSHPKHQEWQRKEPHLIQVALDRLRKVAMDNMCKSLLAGLEVDAHCIQAFLVSVSSHLFPAKKSDNQMDTSIILTLGHIAGALKGTPHTTEYILQILQQRFCNPPSALDSLIVSQMSMMVLAKRDIYEDVMKMFTMILVDPDSKKLYSHCFQAVINLLMTIATHLQEEYDQRDLFIRLLELFVQLGVESNPSEQTSDNIGSMGVLIPIIATISKKIPFISRPKPRILQHFQDFWLFSVVMGYTVESGLWPKDWYEGMKEIAIKSPLLVSPDHQRTELHYNVTIRSKIFTVLEVQKLRSQILYLLKQQDIALIITKLPFAQCTYLLSMYHLEMLRVSNLHGPSAFHCMLVYLEDTNIIRDKAGLWQCVLAVANQVFDAYLETMASKLLKDRKWDKDLEVLAIILLIKFNHPLKMIRKVADKYLSGLVDRFPHLLWSSKMTRSMLNILHALALSLDRDLSEGSCEQAVAGISQVLTLTDNKQSRLKVVEDFHSRSYSILQEALKWAPTTTQSYLQDYIFSINHSSKYLRWHAGASLASKCIIRIAFPEMISQNPPLVDLKEECMPCQSLHSYYYGKVMGLLYGNGDAPHSREAVRDALLQRLEQSWEKKDFELHKEACFSICSLLISNKNMDKPLLKALCISSYKLFAEESMVHLTECWQWLITAHHDVGLSFLQEMAAAWCHTIDKKMGIFAHPSKEGNEIVQCTGPHAIWIKFLSEKMEFAKYCNPEEVQVFSNLMHISFPKLQCSLNDFAGGTFKLLTCTLSLIQGNFIPNSIEKWVLRGRIYNFALKLFATKPSCHRQKSSTLLKDILSAFKFWKVLYSDKKYLKGELIREIWSIVGCQQPCLETTTSYGSICSDPTKPCGSCIESINLSLPLDDLNGFAENITKEFVSKRNLLLRLVASEIDLLITWYNPLASEKLFEQYEEIRPWHTSTISYKASKELVELAWEISPELAVFLPAWLSSNKVLREEVAKRVQNKPITVAHIPDALQYLATAENIRRNKQELSFVLNWAHIEPIRALAFFSCSYPFNSIIAQYATRVLYSCPIKTLMFYIPQLVQALRYDEMGLICQFLKHSASKSQLFAHQLIWNMKANMYKDEEGTIIDEGLHDILEKITGSIVDSLSGYAKHFYIREFDFFDKLTSISKTIKYYPKGQARKNACLDELAKIKVQLGCYLPTNPEAIILDIDASSGTPLNSAAKAPFLAKFKVKKCCLQELENLAMSDNVSLPEAYPEFWQGAIFKVGDDVRQDMLALQIITLFQDIFAQSSLDLFVYPYHVVTMAPGCGVIECIPDSMSRDQLGRQTDMGLKEYFNNKYGDDTSTAYQRARHNFIKSMAAYSVITFLLQIKDRHNGNIMIDSEGHIIHIDFGFMFESSPGGNLGFEPDIKLSEEMLNVMGGSTDSHIFQNFLELCVKAYLAVRPHRETVVALVSLMLDVGLPCFRGQTIKLLNARFLPNATEKEAATYIFKIIQDSLLNFRSKTYDILQYYQNQILY